MPVFNRRIINYNRQADNAVLLVDKHDVLQLLNNQVLKHIQNFKYCTAWFTALLLIKEAARRTEIRIRNKLPRQTFFNAQEITVQLNPRLNLIVKIRIIELLNVIQCKMLDIKTTILQEDRKF